jgi:predicted MPP superfamily phosphohydrolase
MLTHLLVVAGSLYLGAMFYMVLFTVLADCVRLGDHLFHFFPRSFLDNPYPALRIVWLALAGALCVTIGVGNWIATHPVLRCLDLTVAKKSSAMSGLTLAVVSDIHFGTVLGEGHMKKIVRLVKAARPDLVLLAGDVFDEDIDDKQRATIVGLLKELGCPLGVYAITGNHDYYSGLAKAVSVLGEGGVIVLQDSSVVINKAFNLIGRKDLTAKRLEEGRKSLKEIMEPIDRNLPCVLMDHQPFHLEEAEANGVDVQFSGHTHHGQLFPLNLLYRWIYETSWGHIQKGKTQIVVSCGAGTWGPPMRTNSPSEVLKIRMKFAE